MYRGPADRGRGLADRGRGLADRGRGLADRGRGLADRGRAGSSGRPRMECIRAGGSSFLGCV
nr:hypothetical protein [uncultured Lachnoclostridium sp.]